MSSYSRIESMLKRHIAPGIEVAPLSDLVEKIIDYRGISPNKSESGIPLITAKNVRGGFLDFSDTEYIPEKEYESWMSRGLPTPGDLLFTTEAPLGNVAIFPEGRYALAQRVVCIKPKKGVMNSEFLKNYIMAQLGSHQLYLRSSGSTAQGIKVSELRKVFVPILPYEIQERFACQASFWDRAIDLTEKLLAEKMQFRKGLMQQLLTGKRRLPGFGKQASAGKRPDDWTEVPLSELFNPVRRKNRKGVTRVLTASGEHGLVDQGTYFNRAVAGESLAGYFHLRQGEFAYNRSSMNGYPYGAIKRLDEHDEGVLSTLYICFAPASKKCCSDFYKHLFEAGVINKLLRNIVQVGARAHGLLNVSLHNFFSVRVPCPPIYEQEQDASFLNRVDKEILLLHAKLDALKDQKKGLMQQLLTGKKRVTTCAT